LAKSQSHRFGPINFLAIILSNLVYVPHRPFLRLAEAAAGFVKDVRISVLTRFKPANISNSQGTAAICIVN
jgi:hypothetical protein